MRVPGLLLLPLALLLSSCPLLRSDALGAPPACPGQSLLRALGAPRALRGGSDVRWDPDQGGEEGSSFGVDDFAAMDKMYEDPELRFSEEREEEPNTSDDDNEWYNERSRRRIAEAAEREKIENPDWKPKTTGPYAGLPDEATEMCWRLADWYLDRRGAGYKQRHRDSRGFGNKAKRIALTGSLKKMPKGSRRQQQGANKQSLDMAIEELATLGDTILAGTGSGSIMDLDQSDVHGRRWYKSEEGQEYLAKSALLEAYAAIDEKTKVYAETMGMPLTLSGVQARLEAYAAINETTKFYAEQVGMAPEDVAAMVAFAKEHPEELQDPQTKEPLYHFESTSSTDSLGDKFDWGYERFANGSVHAWGDWQREWKDKRKPPKIFRSLEMKREEWRRLY